MTTEQQRNRETFIEKFCLKAKINNKRCTVFQIAYLYSSMCELWINSSIQERNSIYKKEYLTELSGAIGSALNKKVDKLSKDENISDKTKEFIEKARIASRKLTNAHLMDAINILNILSKYSGSVTIPYTDIADEYRRLYI